jgi:hypothetical protein
MRCIPVLLVVACVATPVEAQRSDTTTFPAVARLPREREIALALSAAPPAVAESAEVWVLGDKSYEKVRGGTNGYGCIVQRGMNGQSLIPRCDDASGVAALFPIYQLIETMRSERRTYGDFRRALAEGYRVGTLREPKFGGFSYMYSVDAVFTTDDGRKVGFTPHVMVYWPGCTVNLLGMSKTDQMRGTGLSFLDAGTPECVLVVNTPPATARHAVGEEHHVSPPSQ